MYDNRFVLVFFYDHPIYTRIKYSARHDNRYVVTWARSASGADMYIVYTDIRASVVWDAMAITKNFGFLEILSCRLRESNHRVMIRIIVVTVSVFLLLSRRRRYRFHNVFSRARCIGCNSPTQHNTYSMYLPQSCNFLLLHDDTNNGRVVRCRTFRQ